jgi:hypothetical protein
MRYFACLISFIMISCFGQSTLAQNTESGVSSGQGMESYFDRQTGDFIRYCRQELFPKFEKRRYGLTPFYGQANSFELWADSVDRRYMISVDIAEQGWEISSKKSIPIIFNQYSDDYNIEAFVEIYYHGMPKPILAKKYQVVINGKSSYQILKSTPDWNKLYVPFKKRLLIEKEALKSLAAKVSSDLYSLIN